MVYTCTYKVCTCLTFLNMYIHVKYMSIPFFQILSRWSGFQMQGPILPRRSCSRAAGPAGRRGHARRRCCRLSPGSGCLLRPGGVVKQNAARAAPAEQGRRPGVAARDAAAASLLPTGEGRRGGCGRRLSAGQEAWLRAMPLQPAFSRGEKACGGVAARDAAAASLLLAGEGWRRGCGRMLAAGLAVWLCATLPRPGGRRPAASRWLRPKLPWPAFSRRERQT